MNKRTHENADSTVFDRDPVSQWVDDLRSSAITELDPIQVSGLAEMATAASLASTASLATAAGTTAGAITGGKTMTGLLTTAVAKFAASAAVVATLGAGGAVAGVLPDSLQTGAADVAAQIGIDLPRPDIVVEVDGAGDVVVEVVDGVLDVVAIDADATWEATLRTETDSEIVVDFVSDAGSKTVTVVAETTGGVSSTIEEVSAGADRAATLNTRPSAENQSTIDADAPAPPEPAVVNDGGAQISGSGSVDTGPAGASVNGESSLGLDLVVGD